MVGNGPKQENVRLDRWLWAARFFKTRQLASEAVKGGKVRVNGSRAKPARMVAVGDELEIRRGAYTWAVRVDALSGRRGPASQAAGLYTEHEASAAERARIAGERRTLAAQIIYDREQPSPRDRRAMRQRKRRQ
jgi:ribosome-associated heat shock protein Hsp15